MRFKRARLFIAVGAVVATMSFTGAAMASPLDHNGTPAAKSKTTYTHNHSAQKGTWQYKAMGQNQSAQMKGWQYKAPAQTQAAHNHTSHTSGQQQKASGQVHNGGGQNHGSQDHGSANHE